MDVSKGDWVKHLGSPPWIGQVMEIHGSRLLIDEVYYRVYWLGKGWSWHTRRELIKEEPKP